MEDTLVLPSWEPVLYQVTAQSIILFSLHGFAYDNVWEITAVDEANALLITSKQLMHPNRVLERVVAAVNAHDCATPPRRPTRRRHYHPKVAAVLVSNRIAVQLFLDGVLKPLSFQQAEQQLLDVTLLGEEYEVEYTPVIRVPKVISHKDSYLPLLIISENVVGADRILTLDHLGCRI